MKKFLLSLILLAIVGTTLLTPLSLRTSRDPLGKISLETVALITQATGHEPNGASANTNPGVNTGGGTTGASVGTCNGWTWGTEWVCEAIQGFLLMIYQGAGLLLGAVAFLFDLSIKFTLIDLFSKSPGIIGDGASGGTNEGVVGAIWKVLRDIANLSFIFILLFIAIKTILGQASGNTMRWLITVVVVAILMNFSLFFSKLIIDFGNILALLFYKALGGGTGDISNIFVSGLHLQQWGLLKGGYSLSVVAFGILLGTAGLLVVAFILVSAAVTMLVRSVVLIFVMILSPFAFAAYAAGTGKAKEWSTKWLNYLINYAFVAPIYLFFLYLNARFISAMQQYFNATSQSASGAINPASYTGAIERMADGTIARSDLAPILGFVVVVIGLMLGHYLTKMLSRGAADLSSGWASKGMGLALGGIGGGFLRGSLGGGANALAGRLQKTAFAGTRTGRLALNALKGTADSSFDIRRSKLVQKGAKAGGINLGEGKDTSYVKKKKEVSEAEKKYIDETLKGNKGAQARYATLLQKPVGGASTPVGAVLGAGAGVLSFVRGRRPGEKEAGKKFDTETKIKAVEKPIRDAKNDLQNRLNAINREMQNEIRAGREPSDTMKNQAEIYAEAIESLDEIRGGIKEGKSIDQKLVDAAAGRGNKTSKEITNEEVIKDIRDDAMKRAGPLNPATQTSRTQSQTTGAAGGTPWSQRRPQTGPVNQPTNSSQNPTAPNPTWPGNNPTP